MKRALLVLALAGTADADRALIVPQVGAAIRCDGELDEIAWRTPARTGPFTDATGEQAAPYSDARLLRDDRFLYLALYAADEDIRASDEFVVELSSSRGRTQLHFTAAGALVPAVAHAQVAIDRDGTLDDAKDDDEEWIVEAALPLAALPFASDGSLAARISRCDVTKDGVKRCGAWRGRIAKR